LEQEKRDEENAEMYFKKQDQYAKQTRPKQVHEDANPMAELMEMMKSHQSMMMDKLATNQVGLMATLQVTVQREIAPLAVSVNALQTAQVKNDQRFAALEAAITSMHESKDSPSAREGHSVPSAQASANSVGSVAQQTDVPPQHRYREPLPRREGVGVPVPWMLRKHTILGILGWDVEPQLLLERAKEVISSARIATDSITYMQPTYARGTGSSVDIYFISGEALQQARMKIRDAQKLYHKEARKFAFLDIKKTRHEFRPARLVHRAAECITDVVLQHAGPAADVTMIRKDLRGKFLFYHEMRIGVSIISTWRRTATARAIPILTADVLQFGLDWVNDE
jgi:hypothetical protein